MAGAKGKAKAKTAVPAAVPACEPAVLQRAQRSYQQQAIKKKNLISALEALKPDGPNVFAQRLAYARFLLDKRKELQTETEGKGAKPLAFYNLAMGVYEALEEGCERAVADDEQRSSLAMVLVRTQLFTLLCDLLTGKVEKESADAANAKKAASQELLKDKAGKAHLYSERFVLKGFSRDGWTKDWFDPKSELIPEPSKEKESMSSTVMCAEQMKQLSEAHKQLLLGCLQLCSSDREAMARFSSNKLTLGDIGKQEWLKDVQAVVESAKSGGDSKQLDARMLQQQGGKEQQLAGRGRGGRDVDRAKDTKRGKPVSEGDTVKQKEMEAVIAEEQKLREEANKVLDFLMGKLLREDLPAEEHIAALQQHTTISLDNLKVVVKELSQQKESSKDKTDHPTLQMVKAQMGDSTDSTVSSGLENQLKSLAGKDAWQLFLDEALPTKPGSKTPGTWTSLEEFQEHVRVTHVEDDTAAAQELLAAYELNLEGKLVDQEAEALRQGTAEQTSSNHWLTAFGEECPLLRYVRAHSAVVCEDMLNPSEEADGDTAKATRLNMAAGFALLQMERGVFEMSLQDLSDKPRWAILAAFTLKLQGPLYGYLNADHQDFVIYSFWRSLPACKREYQRITRPLSMLDTEHVADDAPSTSSSSVKHTDGLAEDNATMLYMLWRDQLLQGPVLLALQAFLVRAGQGVLNLHTCSSGKGGRELDKQQVVTALAGLNEQQQTALRIFLLQVLNNTMWSSHTFKGFLTAYYEEWLRPSEVPVVVKGQGKNLQLTLSPKYYREVCLKAALPYEEHDHCCLKHVTKRKQYEQEGKQYSRYEEQEFEAWQCDGELGDIQQPDEISVDRYLVQARRFTQAQEEKQLRIGTQEGLKALVDHLFDLPKHEAYNKLAGAHISDLAVKRTTWDKVRTDLKIACELVQHWQQLHELVVKHQEELDKKNQQLGKHTAEKYGRDVLTQRTAGRISVLRHLNQLYESQQAELQELEQELTEQLRQLADGGQDKGSKANKESSKEKEEKLTTRLQQVQNEITKLESNMVMIRNHESRAITEAQSYPDLISAYHSSDTCQFHALHQSIALLANELLRNSQPDSAAAVQQLREALQLARLSLFDLEVEIMAHALLARRRVLGSMLKHRQVAVLVVLSAEALRKSLREGISKSAEEELLAEEEANASKQQQETKAAGSKKKKKKGAAAKPAAKSHIQRITADTEDEEDEQQQQQQVDEEAPAQDSVEEQQESQLQIDFSKLGLTADELSDDFETPKHHGDSNRSRAAASKEAAAAAPAAAVAAARSAKAAAAEAAASAAAPRPGSATGAGAAGGVPPSRGARSGSTGSSAAADAATAAAAAAPGGSRAGAQPPRQPAGKREVYITYGVNVCYNCGSRGHSGDDCREPYCDSCRRWGHKLGECNRACYDCGKIHKVFDRCPNMQCKHCGLYGHKYSECPSVECSMCHYKGHLAQRCRACPHCKVHTHQEKDCPGFCRNCNASGHLTKDCTVKQRCSVCGGSQHVVGSAECPGSSSSSRGAPPAAASSGSRSSRSGPADRRDIKPYNVGLLPKNDKDEAERRSTLLNGLLDMKEDAEWVKTLLGDEGAEKMALFARLKLDDIYYVLQLPDRKQWLEDLYAHHTHCAAGSMQHVVQPGSLSDELAQQLKEAVPSLPHNWKTMRWAEIEKKLPSQAKRAFLEAKIRAIQEHKREKEKEQQRLQQQQRQQQRQQQQQQRGGRGLERRVSADAQEQSSSSGGGSRPPAAPAATEAKPPAAVSFKRVMAEQPAAPAVEGSAAAAAVASSGSSGGGLLRESLLNHPSYQQQQGTMPPSAAYVQQPADAGAGQPQPWAPHLPPHMSWPHMAPPGMPPPMQQLQQPQLDFSGPPAAWMLWHKEGAVHCVQECIRDPNLIQQLSSFVCDPNVQEQQLVRELEARVQQIIKSELELEDNNPDVGLGLFSELLVEAKKMGGPAPAAPTMQQRMQPSVTAALPPHLQLSLGQQQQHQQPPPGFAPVPIHQQQQPLLLPHMQQQQQPGMQPVMQPGLPIQQQQVAPAAAAVDDPDSDDESMFTLLMTGTQGTQQAPAQQQQQQQPSSAWASNLAGQQQQQADPGFPALGQDDGMQDQRSSSSGQRPAPAISTAGLANETGEYNCFLNVVVQCLWSCRDFRDQVWELLPYQTDNNKVVKALQTLFVQMKLVESHWQPGQDRVVVNPTQLREALDQETHFRRQEMNDAMELLDTIYEQFSKAQAGHDVPGSRGVLIDSVFGLLVNERVRCTGPSCGKITHVISSHWEHLLVVNTMALVLAAYDAGDSSNMGQLLRTLFDQDQKMCDREKGGCGTFFAPERECERSPKVLTLQLVWNQDVSGDDIGTALGYVQEKVDITRLYAAGCQTADTTYQLTSTVAYYGQHYMAFVYNTKLQTWLLFDDASVSSVGTWQDVIKKCEKGKIQPSVLFYQTVDIQAIPDQPVAPAAAAAAAAVPAVPAPVPAVPAPHAVGAAPWPQQQQHQHHQPHGMPPHVHPAAAAAAGPLPPQQQHQQQHMGPPSGPNSGGWPMPAAPLHHAAGHYGSGSMDSGGGGDGRYGSPAQQQLDAWGAPPQQAAAAAPSPGLGPAAGRPGPAAAAAGRPGPAAAAAPPGGGSAPAQGHQAAMSPARPAWGGAGGRGVYQAAAAAAASVQGGGPGGGRAGRPGPITTGPGGAGRGAGGDHRGRG